MDLFTYDIWSIGAIIIFAGTYVAMSICRAFVAFNAMTKIDFSYALECVIVLEITKCIASHSCINSYLVIAVLTLCSYAFSVFVWHSLSVKQRLWLRISMIVLTSIFGIIWVLHAYFGINTFMATSLLWQRFVVPFFTWIILFSRRMWFKILEFIAVLTWREGGSIVRRFAVQIVLRWTRRLVIFLFFYQVMANRMRRIFISERVQKAKQFMCNKKDEVVESYKAMPFWKKLVFCLMASVCVLFVGKSWDFFYPFLPKGAITKLLKGLRFVGTKFGINKTLDKATSFLFRIAMFFLPFAIYAHIEKRWLLFRNWRLRRYAIMLDRLLGVIDKKARDKARLTRQMLIGKIQCNKDKSRSATVDGVW